MKIYSVAPLLVAFLTLVPTAQAQVPQQEQKTAFCATSVELLRAKKDSSDLYLCQSSKYTCAPYLLPSCLDDAKKDGWEVVSSSKQSLLKDYANTPCSCVGTQYVLARKLAAPAAVAPAAAAPIAATVLPAPVPASPAVAPAPAASPSAASLASEVESLKQDNLLIKRQLDQLLRQFDELRRSLPAK
ncbi:MAG: hypothetical protein HXX19_01240 [Rhodoferax sp.]|nr:hypothetical protein [Rhodoferax sp.]